MANWKVPKAVSRVVRPSRIRGTTQLMFVSMRTKQISSKNDENIIQFNAIQLPRDVNGAATEASAIEREIPASAVRKALQSLQPSPTMATW